MIRPARPEDLDAVVAIERRSYRAPWSREAFERDLRKPLSALEVVVAGDPERVVAYVSYWVVVDELHILNLAVDPEARRRGHATALLDHVLSLARAKSLAHLLLEVRPTNAPAVALYRRFGFEEVGVRPHYYAATPGPDPAGPEDALLMTRKV
ncbi:MAG TPA: ribosomal protein S18-alanine N-acetyltransferase [Myxococcota bacterium]|jgi:ribosomal-protein-alanine N-acetyltransferase|nr:ribosomal protein S18-alanine N-acetyltransferase [Myxococcota bacterium]